jgi:hypothetical protein
MEHLNPEKLHVNFIGGAHPDGPITPRKYTLTHSDMTGDLFLTISQTYNFSQISGLYTRIMRDEVLATWDELKVLHVHCHVSGGLVFGSSNMRYMIFQASMPLVLESFWYGDRIFLSTIPELSLSKVIVHFHSRKKKYKRNESWGVLEDYKVI